MRFFRAATAAALALSLTATPVLAQSAAPLSVARGAAVIDDGNSLADESGYLIPAAVIIAVLVVAVLVTKGDDDDDFGNPVSP
jgi:hypothetical protein